MINNAPVSYENANKHEPKLLSDVNVADIMHGTIEILINTREYTKVIYNALFGSTRPDPEMTVLNGGSIVEMLDDMHSLARDIIQMELAIKCGLGIEEKSC